jgi:tRNA dimethylallyltransferase
MQNISREEIYENINKRVDEMIKIGLEDEFKKIVEKYGAENKIIENTIGYSEFLKYNNKDEIVSKIKQHTRNFAKRQLTYFRNNNEIGMIEENFNIS